MNKSLLGRRSIKKRGLQEVAYLAQTLDCLGWSQFAAQCEAQMEGDESQVPAMLLEALKSVGDALLAMTEEEITELISDAAKELAGDDDDLTDGERAYVHRAITPLARNWRRQLVRVGKTLSATNEEHLERAKAHHERAFKHHDRASESHAAVGDKIEEMRAHHRAIADGHEKIGEELRAAAENPAEASDHVSRAMAHHSAMAEHIDCARAAHADLADAHEDVGDCHRALKRSLKAAHRCVRAVLEGSIPEDDGGEDGGEKNGETSSRSLRARQVEVARALLEIK